MIIDGKNSRIDGKNSRSNNMTLEGVLKLCEMNRISHELFCAAKDWLINPENFIPPRTINHALSLFERKISV